MKLKDIAPYIFGDFIVNVDDATDEEFSYIEDFMSSDKEKMELYAEATVSNIMPNDINYVQVNVCIND